MRGCKLSHVWARLPSPRTARQLGPLRAHRLAQRPERAVHVTLSPPALVLLRSAWAVRPAPR